MKVRTRGAAALALALGACATAPARDGVGASVVEIVMLDPPAEAEGAAAAAGGPAEAGTGGPVETRAPVEPTAPELPRADVLPGVHPALRERAAELVRRLAAEGIAVKLIFGYTRYVPRKRTGPGGWASWHEFGLAFDLNLAAYKSLGEAKKHFGPDADKWRRIGALSAELGLVWGGAWRTSYDPFHIEWHPGDDSVINRQDLAAFLRLAGKDGRDYTKVWSLYPASASDTR
ncbi:MAG: M15 family metallopeptidase [Myxococcota bacterium]